MEEIALINPPRRRNRRKATRRQNAPRRAASGRFTSQAPRRRNRAAGTRSHRRRNPELMLLNPGTKRRRHYRRNDPGRRRHYARRNDPGRQRHYRRNPGMMEEFLPSTALSNIAWGAGGALGTAALSKLLLPQATGIMGLLRDAVSVLGIGWVARQVGGREAQTAAIIGGGTVLAVKLLNTMGIGRGFGLASMADDDYNELGAYYEDPSLGAYYEDTSLDVPWQGGTMASLGAYYEDPSLGDLAAIEDYDDPGLFDLGDEDDELGDDEDELGDDEDEDETEDFDADDLGDDEDEDEMGMFG